MSTRPRPARPTAVSWTILLLTVLAACSSSATTAPDPATSTIDNPCTTADPLAGCGEPDYRGTGPTVLVLGDSITDHSRSELHEALTGHAVRISGWVGSTVGLNRQYIDALGDDQPDVVVVNLGTNDAWQHVPVTASVADLDALLERFGDSCKVLVTVTTLGEQGYDRAIAAAFNDAIADRADVVVEWNDVVVNEPQLLDPDGIHPTIAGRQRLAELVATAVDECPTSEEERSATPAEGAAG
jgi:lysophospholipase L1-like esterase